MRSCNVLMILPLCLLPMCAMAADTQGHTATLFDGKTLNGWHVSGCEAIVQDGAILLKAGNGLVRTDHQYTDFVLEYEWKALRREGRWDSGVYFRCELPADGKPWPSRYQANLLKGQEGNIGGVAGATSSGLVKDGEWNRFKLTVVGTKVALEINGQKAYEADGINNPSGYIGLQAEVPGGGEFLFRTLVITELRHATLFNGKDLTGWEGAGGNAEDCWVVEDGAIVGLEKNGPWLRSKKQYDDFNLRLDYKVSSGANSGVYIRVPEDGNHHGQDSGIEVQILDDHDEKYAKLKPYQFCGGLYDFAGPTEKVGLPLGEWNHLEINAQGHKYRISHNGVVIVEADAGKYPELEQRLLKGHLGLQNHGGGVSFRNIRIGPPLP